MCLCTTDSEQGFVYAYVGLARMQLLCARASLGVQPPSVCPRQYMQRSSGKAQGVAHEALGALHSKCWRAPECTTDGQSTLLRQLAAVGTFK